MRAQKTIFICFIFLTFTGIVFANNLPHLTENKTAALFIDFNQGIKDLSSNHRKVATVKPNINAQLVNSSTGKKVLKLTGKIDEILYAAYSPSLVAPHGITAEIVFKIPSQASKKQFYLLQNGHNWGLFYEGGIIRGMILLKGAWQQIVSPAKLTPDVWHSVKFSYNAEKKEQELYVDGKKVATNNMTKLTLPNYLLKCDKQRLAIGLDASLWGSKPMIGEISQIQIITHHKKITAKDLDNSALNVKKIRQLWHDQLVGVANLRQCQKKKEYDNATGAEIVNYYQTNNPQVNFRQEIINSPNSMEMLIKAEYNSYKKLAHGYSFELPLNLLHGANYKLYHGRHWGYQVATGKFDLNAADGQIKGGYLARFLIIEKNGKSVTFDFNLSGVHQGYAADYPSGGEIVGNTKITKHHDKLVFSFFERAASDSGGLYGARFKLVNGAVDIKKIHPYLGWDYHVSPAQAKWNFTFGALPNWNRVDKSIYDQQQQQFGWTVAPTGELQVKNPKNYYDNCYYNTTGKPETFQFQATPGLYLIIVNAGSPQQAVSVMKIAINGELQQHDIKVVAGGNQRLSQMYYLKEPDKMIKMTFSGSHGWAVKNIMITPVCSQYEDYFITRKLWHDSMIPTPDIGIAQPVKYAHPALFKTPKYDPSKMAWRKNMRMTNWSLESHAGSNFEYNTPELIARRVADIKQGNYNTINLGVAFWSLSYRDRADEIVTIARMITEAAHKAGLVVVYHVDLPVLFNIGTGIDYLIKHHTWIKSNIQTGSPSFTLMCFNNPGFQHDVRQYLKRFAYEAGVDGFMLDEFYAHAKEMCGCESCRKQFTKDTGAKLPLDVSAKMWFNNADETYVKFVKWRMKNIGDAWETVYNDLKQINPNIVLMAYATEGVELGYNPKYSNAIYAIELTEMARGANFLGTEMMSNNIIDIYKTPFMFRKINYAISRNALADSVPWVLVYNVGRYSCYAGWAANNMNLCASWIPTQYDDSDKYLNWNERLDIDKWASAAEIAIMFSITTRDFGQKDYLSIADMMGVSQMMTDKHIMHDFILGKKLSLTQLKKYKLLILPSISCLADETIKVVRDYVQSGGRILVMGNTGKFNENGIKVDRQQLAQLTGVKLSDKKITTASLDGVKLKFPVMKVTPVTADLLASFTAENESLPLFTINKLGKGEVYYLAAPLGLANYEEPWMVGQKYNNTTNLALAQKMVDFIRQSFGQNLACEIKAPKRILVSYLQAIQQPGHKAIALLNLTAGRKYKIGDVIGSENYRDPFPPVKDAIIAEISLPEVNEAYIVSPDYPGEKRTLKWQKIATGKYRFTIEGKNLKTYSIVYIK